MVTTPALSLADLQAHDPHPSRAGGNDRYCCPLPACAAKKVGKDHQSLAVDRETGAWCCHRCGEKGKLSDFWQERPNPKGTRRERERTRLKRAFDVTVKQKAEPVKPEEENSSLARRMKQIQNAYTGTPAATYLESRGVPPGAGEAARVRYAPAWDHWEKEEGGQLRKAGTDRRVVFQLTDRQGRRVAISARAIDAEFHEPKAQTIGAKKGGVFVTPGALAAAPPIVVEAPIDALSLYACGFPALATCGTSWPDWLPDALALRPVLIGYDNDPSGEGDKAAAKLAGDLQNAGAKCYRLRPAGKDWNEDLQALGIDALRESLRAAIAGMGLGSTAAEAPPEEVTQSYAFTPESAGVHTPDAPAELLTDTNTLTPETDERDEADPGMEDLESLYLSEPDPEGEEAQKPVKTCIPARAGESGNAGNAAAPGAACPECGGERFKVRAGLRLCAGCCPDLPAHRLAAMRGELAAQEAAGEFADLEDADPLDLILDAYGPAEEVLPLLQGVGVDFLLKGVSELAWTVKGTPLPLPELHGLIRRHRTRLIDLLKKERRAHYNAVGRVLQESGELLKVKEIKDRAGLTERQTRDALSSLYEAGLVMNRGDSWRFLKV